MEYHSAKEAAQPPVVSVLVVSDYDAGGDTGWEGTRKTLEALARQNFQESAEFLWMESADLASGIPDEFRRILPSLRIVTAPYRSSYELKNEAVRVASAELLAMLDADCVPDPNWLRSIVEALRRHPEAVAVSGRTVYRDSGRAERLLALLGRSYLDPGRAGRSRFISNNNAGWRRAARLEYPLPSSEGPFAARMQSEALLRAGARFWFDPAIRVVHEFEGWAMEADIRRNIGYGTIITRLRDSRLPYAWLARLGRLSIPFVVVGKTLQSWADSLRCAPAYGVRWHELPLALLLAVVLQLMEIPGMWDAYRGRLTAGTAYR